MVYLISAFWAALEYIHFYLFWGAFLPSKCSRKKRNCDLYGSMGL